MPYGMLTNLDCEALERTLSRVVDHFQGQKLTVVEIGICKGDTSRGVRDFLVDKQAAFEYWGVDSRQDKSVAGVPFPGMKMAWGNSADVYYMVPDKIHWLLIDGCHCLQHIILDFWLYAPKLVEGGVVLLHDSTPSMMNFTTYMGHGPMDRTETHVSTRRGLERMGLLPNPFPPWKLIEDVSDGQGWGGFVGFTRMKGV